MLLGNTVSEVLLMFAENYNKVSLRHIDILHPEVSLWVQRYTLLCGSKKSGK